jgi:hypothetical protein
MTTPISYPLINGNRQDPSSTELKFGPPVNAIMFFASFNYGRTRSRSQVEANHPDPLGKTRGRNAYKCDVELYLAEFNLLQGLLVTAAGGNGYGDIYFPIFLNYTENGFDPISIQILGCTLDVDESAVPKGTDALTVKVEFSPLKVLVNGSDDLAVPLIAPAGI